MISVEHIYRYPIKGFPGEHLQKTNLQKNQGIQGDRTIGLSTGVIAVQDNGAWTPCQAFQRMTIRPDLTTFNITNTGDGLRLTSANNETEIINLKTSDTGSLINILGNPVVLHRAGGNRGYWDHQDAAVSIINLSTLDVISEMIGRSIDPLRFRANIYVRAEPWSEFSWLGRELAIGGARLDIIRPIDRCRTTSVNVDTGVLDINMPALLNRHFGHMYCGVYASVNTGASIAVGETIKLSDDFTDKKIRNATTQKTAPSLHDWPRPVVVTKIKEEAEGIRSLWIDDSLCSIGSLAKFKPGQYIRVHGLSGAYTWRSYTVSAISNGQLRITVKRQDGVGSQSIHQFSEGQKLVMTGPFGDATLANDSKALHFISAGIGITPTVAKLQALAAQRCSKPIKVIHVARSKGELALWNDVIDAAKKLPNAVLNLHLTNSQALSVGVLMGRPDPQVIAVDAKRAAADVHICGPTAFVSGLLDALKSTAVQDSKIFVDTFSSANSETQLRSIAKSAPIKVTLARSKISEYWSPDDGTLLDFAESRGAVLSSHCRAGICKTCSCKILQGSATRLLGEEGEDHMTTLLCCSVPKVAITLDV